MQNLNAPDQENVERYGQNSFLEEYLPLICKQRQNTRPNQINCMVQFYLSSNYKSVPIPSWVLTKRLKKAPSTEEFFKTFQNRVFNTSLSALKEFLMTRNQSMASEKMGAQRTLEIRFLSVP